METYTLFLVALVGLGGAGGSDARSATAAVYEQAAPAVVGLECEVRAEREVYQYFGTGVIVDPAGLVLTSISVVPESAREVRVYLRGGRVYPAEILKVVAEKEFCLLRITRSSVFPYLALGDSDEVGVGSVGVTMGNAFHSIKNDDQVAVASGLVSGRYTLETARSQARYVGPVLETTAALNDGMDGGPLLNAHGEVIGLLSLNFSTNRWLGTAIPINALKPLLSDYRRTFSDRRERLAAYLGVEVVEGAGAAAGSSPRIERVDRDGPAYRAGLRAGDILHLVDGRPVATVGEVRDALAAAVPGSAVLFEVSSPLPDPRLAVDFRLLRAETPIMMRRRISVAAWGRF